MKTRRMLYGFVVCALLMTSCRSPVQLPGGADEEIQEAVEQATEKSQELLADVSEAITSGDFSGLQQFLAAEDRDGELEALLAQHGITASTKAMARGFVPGWW